MIYQPLKPQEIRVLKIITPPDGCEQDISRVHCVLEHVTLLPAAPERSSTTKGHNGQWLRHDTGTIEFEPTIRPLASTNVLWKEGRAEEAHKDSACKLIHLHTEQDFTFLADDESLEWRYPWGDYAALSYVWGNSTCRKEIVVNDTIFEVTENLEAALQILRCSPRVVQGFKLWIDAICINQSDVEERSAQVAKMQEIYSGARFVMVWLGQASENSALAMTAVRWLAVRAQSSTPLEGFYKHTKTYDYRPLFIKWSQAVSPLRDEVYIALRAFFQRPYWRRLWILQEIALGSPESVVLCGSDSVTWREIYCAATFIDQDEQRFGKRLLEDHRLFSFEWDLSVDRLALPGSERSSAEKTWKRIVAIAGLQTGQKCTTLSWKDAHKAFILTHDANVTDERDRVYGILGLSSVRGLTNLYPDYKLTSNQAFYNFTKSVVESGHLDILRLVQSPVGPIDDPEGLLRVLIPSRWQYHVLTPRAGQVVPSCPHDLPSWVICWTCPRSTTVSLPDCALSPIQAGVSPVISTSGNTLIVHGARIAGLAALSAFHRNEQDQRYPWNSGQTTQSAYQDGQATKEAFWRTLVANTSMHSDEIAPATYSILLEPGPWCDAIAGVRTNSIGLHDFMARNSNLDICGRSLKKFVLGSSSIRLKRAIYDPSAVQIEALSRAVNALAWRRFMVTDNGYFGLCPADTRASDGIYQITGCNAPLVLRPVGDHFRIVGECYVHDYPPVVSEARFQDINLH